MITILLFGAGGQLGQELLARAPTPDIAIVGRTRSEVDIANEAEVHAALTRIRPDIVVNAGGYTKVDKAEAEPDAAFKANAMGPAVLARACKRAGIALVHLSTDYVFDGKKMGAYVETDPIGPLGVYGRSKAEGEAAVRAELDRHIILRTSWLYGAYGANFLKTILRLAGERDEIRVVADQYGCPTGTVDLAEAVLRVAPMLGAGSGVWGTYNFAGLGRTTWYGFASVIADELSQLSGRRVNIVPIASAEYASAARRPENSELDSSRFANIFGFSAIPWEKRARELVRLLWRSNSR